MSVYEPATRGDDVLYRVIERDLSTFLDLAEQRGRPIPRYVERELASYLACGIVRHGFTLLRCTDCPAWWVVPFTCKGRGFCPSCGGRQMNQQAAHLMDRVFPDVPVRQWVLTLPFPLRVRMAWDIELRKAVHGVYRRVVFGWYRRRAMTLLGVPDGECGSVTFVQNFGSSRDRHASPGVHEASSGGARDGAGPGAAVDTPRQVRTRRVAQNPLTTA